MIMQAFKSVLTDNRPVPTEDNVRPMKETSLKRNYDRIKWLWILIIVFGLVVQSLRTARMSGAHEAFVGKYVFYTSSDSTAKHSS